MTIEEEQGTDVVRLSKGYGHAINRSVRGLLLLLPTVLNNRQVVEIGCHQNQEIKRAPNFWKELCKPSYSGKYTVKLYVAGIRFLFEIPGPSQLPKVWFGGPAITDHVQHELLCGPGWGPTICESLKLATRAGLKQATHFSLIA